MCPVEIIVSGLVQMKESDYHRAISGCKDLQGAKLRKTDLFGVDLWGADLSGADLSGAFLQQSNLCFADLTGADLTGAFTHGANFFGAILIKTTGLKSSTELMNKYFQKDKDGWFVYKSFAETEYMFSRPDNWNISPGCILEEPNLALDRRYDCGPGVNFASRQWIKKRYGPDYIWLCKVYKEDIDQIVVPYGTDGKGRCARLQLIGEV